jgi:hypothetical protein
MLRRNQLGYAGSGGPAREGRGFWGIEHHGSSPLLPPGGSTQVEAAAPDPIGIGARFRLRL